MKLHLPEIRIWINQYKLFFTTSLKVEREHFLLPTPWQCQELEWISIGKTFSYMSFSGWQKWERHRYYPYVFFKWWRKKPSVLFFQMEISLIWDVFWPLCYEALQACFQSLCLRKAVSSFLDSGSHHAEVSGMSYCFLNSLILPLIHISKSTCYIWVIPKTALPKEKTCSETS